MSKKIVILVVFVLLLIIGGVFYWQKIRTIKGSPDDYVIKETAEGTIVENKKAGLRMKVPEGWQVEKIEVMEGSVVFYSPDAEGVRTGKVRPPLKKGCLIETAVAYRKMSFSKIKEEIEEGHKWLAIVSDVFKMIGVNNYPALKNTYDCLELGPSIDVYIPLDSKLYDLGISVAPGDKERCFQEFDKFLETVSIE